MRTVKQKTLCANSSASQILMDCYCIQIHHLLKWFEICKYANSMPDLTMYNPDSYTIATEDLGMMVCVEVRTITQGGWSVQGPGASFSRGHFNLEWQLPWNHRLPVTPQILGELR